MENTRNCSVLLLDDLGSEKRSPWTDEPMYWLLNHRYNEGLPTVIASNVLFDELEPHIASRMQDSSLSREMVLLASEDQRMVRALHPGVDLDRVESMGIRAEASAIALADPARLAHHPAGQGSGACERVRACLLTLAMATKARGFLFRCGALHRESYSHARGVAFPQALRYVLKLLSSCASEKRGSRILAFWHSGTVRKIA